MMRACYVAGTSPYSLQNKKVFNPIREVQPFYLKTLFYYFVCSADEKTEITAGRQLKIINLRPLSFSLVPSYIIINYSPSISFS